MAHKKVMVICEDCGCEYIITDSSFRRIKNSNGRYKWRCKPCYKKWRKNDWYNELPEERRAELSEKRSELSKKVWSDMDPEKKQEAIDKCVESRVNRSEEEKEATRQKLRQTWDNMSAERKAEISETKRSITQSFWDNLSEEEYKAMCEKMSIARIEAEANMSEEEYARYNAQRTAAIQNYWDTMTDEERERLFQVRSAAQKEQWTRKTPESREHIIRNLVKGRIKWWSELSEEDKIAYGENIRERWANRSMEEFEEWITKTIGGKEINPTATEKAFHELLTSIGIKSEMRWLNKILHPEFREKFPYNPNNGSPRVSFQHPWDFKLNFPSGETILVDIDGSIHGVDRRDESTTFTDPSGNSITLRSIIEFSNAKRPYQTDGFDAYAVQALKDELNDDVDVIHIQTNEVMKFKDFVAMLKFRNLSKHEQSQAVNQ